MMFEIELQLFGGGGSKSGLGGGGVPKTNTEQFKTYRFALYDERNKSWIAYDFKGRTPEEARKKAKKYADAEGYGRVSEKYKEINKNDKK